MKLRFEFQNMLARRSIRIQNKRPDNEEGYLSNEENSLEDDDAQVGGENVVEENEEEQKEDDEGDEENEEGDEENEEEDEENEEEDEENEEDEMMYNSKSYRAKLAIELEAKKLEVLREKERIKIASEKRAKDAAEEKQRVKDTQKEKRKKEADEERLNRELKKNQKKKDNRQNFSQIFQGSDDDEDTIEQIKIRLLNGPNSKQIPDEFKNLSVFHHPISLIKNWSLNNVNINLLKIQV